LRQSGIPSRHVKLIDLQSFHVQCVLSGAAMNTVECFNNRRRVGE
jgi:hypothetical protein